MNEGRIALPIDDLAAVVFECRKCESRLSVPAHRMNEERIGSCPICRAEWYDHDKANLQVPVSGYARLALASRSAVDDTRERNYRVYFEFSRTPSDDLTG